MALGKTADLLIKIGADGKQAVSEMQKVKGSVGDLSNSLRSGNVLGFSNSIKQMAGSMGTGKLAAIGMTAGVVALGAAATATVGYLFELTKQAADYGSEIYDATVVTGFSAETLSALRVQGEMAGVEFDKLTQGIFKFSIAAGKATEENKKAQEALAFFGLTGKQVSNDLEGSFAKVVARLNEMAPGVEKNSKAAAIFGNRDAKAMLKVIEQINGNVPKTVEEMKRLGITISGSAAKASDEFADSLVLLGAQFEGVKRTIGFAFMPVFREALGEISRWFADNSTNVQVWAARSSDAFRTVLRGLQTLVQFIIDNPVLVGAALGGAAGSRFGPWGTAIGAASGAAVFKTIAEGSKPEASNKKIEQLIRSGMSQEAIKALYESAYPNNEAVKSFVEGILKYNYDRIKKETDDAAKVAADAAIATSVGGDADAAKKKAEKDRADKVRVLKADIDIVQEQMKKIISDLDKELEDKFPSILPSPALIADETDAALKALDEAWFKTVVKRGEIKALLLEGAETPKEKEAIEKEYIAESSRLFEDYWQRRLDIQKKGNEQIFKSAQVTDKKYLDEIKRSAESQLTFLEGLRDSKFYTEEEYLNAKLAINNSLIRAEIDYYQLIASAANTSVEDRRDALEKIKDLNAKLLANEIETQNGIAKTKEKVDKETPLERAKKSWQEYFETIKEGAGSVEGALGTLGTMGLDVLQNMEGALKSSISNWILYGESVGKALKKALAAQLASVAAEAAVWALKAAALGFYLLAIHDYSGAASAFKSAAVWGAVAVLAGVTARAIAGDSFKNESSRATTGERASQRNTAGQGQAFSSQGNQTINATQSGVSLMPTAEIVIRDASGMFSQLFEAEIRNNSRVRRLIIDTANS